MGTKDSEGYVSSVWRGVGFCHGRNSSSGVEIMKVGDKITLGAISPKGEAKIAKYGKVYTILAWSPTEPSLLLRDGSDQFWFKFCGRGADLEIQR